MKGNRCLLAEGNGINKHSAAKTAQRSTQRSVHQFRVDEPSFQRARLLNELPLRVVKALQSQFRQSDRRAEFDAALRDVEFNSG